MRRRRIRRRNKIGQLFSAVMALHPRGAMRYTLYRANESKKNSAVTTKERPTLAINTAKDPLTFR